VSALLALVHKRIKRQREATAWRVQHAIACERRMRFYETRETNHVTH
jgi:hypothetical protein